MSTAAAKLLASCSTRLPPVSRASSECSGGHGVPGEDMKQLVSQVEVTPAVDFATCDQDRVQFRQTAGRARNTVRCIDHEDQNAEFSFHDVGQAHRRYRAQFEFTDEPVAGLHRIFETRVAGETECPAQERCITSNLGSQRPVRGNPAPRIVFIGCELLCVDARLPP